jgi:hypothetical protein
MLNRIQFPKRRVFWNTNDGNSVQYGVYVEISVFWQRQEVWSSDAYLRAVINFSSGRENQTHLQESVKSQVKNSLYLPVDENHTRAIMTQLPHSNFPLTDRMACINPYLGELKFF